MVHKRWVPRERKHILCIDSYDRGIPRGRFYTPGHGSESFDSLSQFLLKMESTLDHTRQVQSATARRSFCALLLPEESRPTEGLRRGRKATFELQILFRQNTSWQGVLIWQERKMEQTFRSVLELISLLDSALRD